MTVPSVARGVADLSRTSTCRSLPQVQAVGAVFGRTCSKYHRARLIEWQNTRCGDDMMRFMPYEALEHAAFREVVMAQGLGDADRRRAG